MKHHSIPPFRKFGRQPLPNQRQACTNGSLFRQTQMGPIQNGRQATNFKFYLEVGWLEAAMLPK